MSFGFSAGDFLAAYQLANRVRKEFTGAPSQFKNISDEVRNLSIVLQDSECAFESHGSHGSRASHGDNKEVEQIISNCQTVLDELKQTLEKYRELQDTRAERSSKEKARRVWKRLTFEPEDIRDLRGRICSNIAALNAYNTRLTRDNTARLLQQHEKQEHEIILKWLTEVDFGPQHSHNLSCRQSGTGTWFLESKEYQGWINKETKTLFCPGIPGAGKTIMAAIVIDDLHRRIESDDFNTSRQVDHQTRIGLAFIYCDFRTKHSLEILLASLLKQLSKKTDQLPESVIRLYDRHKDMCTRPSPEELSETLKSVINSHYSRVFIVIDAIDECSTKGNTRTKFPQAVTNLQETSATDVLKVESTCVSILATSRYIPSVERLFGSKDCEELEIAAQAEDIEKYMDGQMDELPEFVSEKPELLHDIKTGILEAVTGMFLLAKLYLDSLKGETRPRGIRDALRRFPVGSETLMYDFAYEDAMRRIQSQPKGHVELAMQVLMWITSVEEPMATTQIIDALAVDVDDEYFDEERRPRVADVISVCAGLVVIDWENETLRLVHYTTQEYFDRTRDTWFPDADAELTRICLSYISFTELDPKDLIRGRGQSPSLGPFGEYALLGWAIHCNRVAQFWKGNELRCKSESLINMVADFVQSPKAEAISQFLSFIIFNDGEEKARHPVGRKRPSWLHLASTYNLCEVIRSKGNYDVNARDSFDRTPLHYAAVMGHDEVIRLLLSTQNIDVNLTDISGASALWWAVSGAKASVVELLLQTEKVDVNLRGGRVGLTPAQLAVERGYLPSLEAILRAKGVEADTLYESGENMLFRAVRKKAPSMVEILIRYSTRLPGILEQLLSTELLQAMRLTPYHIAERLCGHTGSDLERVCQLAVTALLFEAITLKNETAIIIILRIGPDLEAEGAFFSETPLLRAVALWAEPIVRLLLEHGANVDRESGSIKVTALFRAITSQNEAIISLLLSHGADVNRRSTVTNETPLLLAMSLSSEGTADLLLQMGANINQEAGWHNETPLLRAVISRDDAMARLLLRKGAEVDKVSGSLEETALHRAVFSCQDSLVEALLDNGADPKQGSNLMSSLTHAVLTGRPALVKMLLGKGADPNEDCGQFDRIRWTSYLQLCGKALNDQRLSKEVILEDEKSPLWTPLMCAILLERLVAAAKTHQTPEERSNYWNALPMQLTQHVRSFLKYNEEVQPSSEANEDRWALVRLLVEHGVDINASNKWGFTALDIVSFGGGHHEIIKYLTDKGAVHGDLNAAQSDKDGACRNIDHAE